MTPDSVDQAHDKLKCTLLYNMYCTFTVMLDKLTALVVFIIIKFKSDVAGVKGLLLEGEDDKYGHIVTMYFKPLETFVYTYSPIHTYVI